MIDLRRDITVLRGPGINAASRIDLRAYSLGNILTFVIAGKESDWSVDPGQVSDPDDSEQIAMFYYDSITNNRHLQKVGGY
jgi:hypothetical protein